MNFKTRTSTFLAAVLAVAGLSTASDYSSWARVRTVTVNTSAMTLGSAVTNVPILVRFNATSHKDMLDSATQILANGADIRVTKADGTTDVPFEIETATTGATGTAALWIKADNVAANSATAATFKVYWGKAGATTLSNSTAVFDTANGFVAVWHMNGLTDATANGYTLSTTAAPITAVDTNSLIGVSKTFASASSQFYAISGPGNTTASRTTLDLNVNNGPYTITAWAKPNSCTARMTAIAKYDGSAANGDSTRQWALQTKNTATTWGMSNDPNLPAFTSVAAGNEYVADQATTCAVASTTYLAGSYSHPGTPVVNVSDSTGAARLRFQVNNGPIATSGLGGINAGSQIGTKALPFIGKMQGAGAASRFMDGTLDEITVSKVQRDTNWVELNYETQKKTVTAVSISASAIPAPFSPYGAWANHRTIKLNTTAAGANVATTVTKFPLLVRLGSNEGTILSGSKSDGSDIRFSKANDSTPLPYQIETWTPTSAAIWVLADTVKGNDSAQSIRIHWGNSSAADSSNGAAVFDTANGFVAVWHLGNASGTSPRPNAVTGAPQAVLRNMAVGYQPVVGLIGMADSLPGGSGDAAQPGVANVVAGTKPYIDIGRTSYTGFMNFTAGMSYSVWISMNTSSTGFERFLQMLGDDTTNAVNGPGNSPNRLAFLRHTNNTSSVAARFGSLVTTGNSVQTTFGANTWRQVGFSKTPGNDSLYLYVDGVRLHAYAVNGDLPVITRNNSSIGRSYDTTNGYLNAKVDAPMMSKVPRSHSWMKLAYENQKAVNSLTDIGLGGALVITAPGAPTTVTGVAGNAQVTVSWVAPASNGGAAITGYKAVAVSDTTKSCTTTGALTCTITALTNGTGYTFTVKATNSAGTSAASTASATVTPVAPNTAPGAPTGVTGAAGAAGSGTVTVTWVAPASNGGSAITGYKAMAVSDTSKTCSTTGALTCAVTTLTNGTAYTFYVRAVNAVGSSATSAASAAVTVPVSIGPGSLLINVGSFTKAYTFQLPEAAVKVTENLTMSISDAWGRTVWERTINPSESKQRTITWNGMTSKGGKVSAGMYIVRIHAANASSSQDAIQAGVKLQ